MDGTALAEENVPSDVIGDPPEASHVVERTAQLSLSDTPPPSVYSDSVKLSNIPLTSSSDDLLMSQPPPPSSPLYTTTNMGMSPPIIPSSNMPFTTDYQNNIRLPFPSQSRFATGYSPSSLSTTSSTNTDYFSQQRTSRTSISPFDSNRSQKAASVRTNPYPAPLQQNNLASNNNNNWLSVTPLSLSPYESAASLVDSTSTDQIARPTTPHRYSLADFQLLQTLGTGTFGRVFLARSPPHLPHRHHATSRESSPIPVRFHAIKVLIKSELVRLKQIEHTNSERLILSSVHHPFIISLFCTFQSPKYLFMCLDYVIGGELFTHLRHAGRFVPDVAKFYAASIVLAVEYMHSQGIIYRDLKPENLLLDHTGYLKIVDFGFSKRITDRLGRKSLGASTKI